MKKICTFYTVCLLIIMVQYGCSAGKETDQHSEASGLDSAAIKNDGLTGCYTMHLQRDTAQMQIAVSGSVVAGTLSYTPFEKDRSKGTLHGFIVKNNVKAWYTFQSEGRTSVREINFKIINGTLAEGYGEVTMSNDSVHFQYPANLNYEVQHPFTKVDCK